MTSTAVAASGRTFFAGPVAAGTSAGNDVGNSFSDVLKTQRNNGTTAEKESPARQDGRIDRLSDSGGKNSIKTKNGEKISPEDAIEQAEKAAEAMAGEMITQVAEEMGITEEEVLQILDDLKMTPMDLLDLENLQAVVLAAAGETDVSNFVTDEQLFSAFKNLASDLEQVLAEVSDATGLEREEVKAVFDGLMNSAKTELSPEEAALVQEETVQVESTEETDQMKSVKTQNSEAVNIETEDGSDIMLERSLARNEAENGKQSDLSGETAHNPFAQNLTTGNFTQSLQAVQDIPGYFTTDTEMILNQIADYMKGQITDGVSELEMQLHPESLGNLHIRLTSKEGVLTAQFTAQNDTVKTVLESQMIQLKETFKEQGVTVDNIEVTVESRKFDQNLSQHHDGSMNDDNNQGTRQRSRRINLDALTEEDILTEEDRIAAEMLQDSGGTVDYTV